MFKTNYVYYQTPGSGAHTFNPALASVILSRRKSIDGADLMTNNKAISPAVADVLKLGSNSSSSNLVKSRSLPCVDSWGMLSVYKLL